MNYFLSSNVYIKELLSEVDVSTESVSDAAYVIEQKHYQNNESHTKTFLFTGLPEPKMDQ